MIELTGSHGGIATAQRLRTQVDSDYIDTVVEEEYRLLVGWWGTCFISRINCHRFGFASEVPLV